MAHWEEVSYAGLLIIWKLGTLIERSKTLAFGSWLLAENDSLQEDFGFWPLAFGGERFLGTKPFGFELGE
jgi:hypothetical protein